MRGWVRKPCLPLFPLNWNWRETEAEKNIVHLKLKLLLFYFFATILWLWNIVNGARKNVYLCWKSSYSKFMQVSSTLRTWAATTTKHTLDCVRFGFSLQLPSSSHFMLFIFSLIVWLFCEWVHDNVWFFRDAELIFVSVYFLIMTMLNHENYFFPSSFPTKKLPET